MRSCRSLPFGSCGSIGQSSPVSNCGPPTAPITHSDRFVLVDPELRIRGYYHGSDPADLERLADDARHLAPALSG